MIAQYISHFTKLRKNLERLEMITAQILCQLCSPLYISSLLQQNVQMCTLI